MGISVLFLIKWIGISGAVVIVFLRIAISRVASVVIAIPAGVTIGATVAIATCRGLKILTPNYLICELLIRAIFIIS